MRLITAPGQPYSRGPRQVFAFARPGMFKSRIVRFNHEANSWQVNRPAAPDKFNNIPAELARSHAFAGYVITTTT